MIRPLGFDWQIGIGIIRSFAAREVIVSTQAISRRETNSWKWPAIQLGYMTLPAYVASLAVYQALRASGVA